MARVDPKSRLLSRQGGLTSRAWPRHGANHTVMLPSTRLFHAAPLPLLVTALFLAAAVFFAAHAHLTARLLALVPAGLAISAALLALGDALSRHAESRRVRRMLARHGFDERVFDAMAASRCQRDAALCAAGETGFLAQARAYYHSLGYRWHHLLPDSARRAPWRLLAPRFFKKSFLAFGHAHRRRK